MTKLYNTEFPAMSTYLVREAVTVWRNLAIIAVLQFVQTLFR